MHHPRITALHEISGGQVVAIDGKTLRRSFDKAAGKSAIHMVRAWAKSLSHKESAGFMAPG